MRISIFRGISPAPAGFLGALAVLALPLIASAAVYTSPPANVGPWGVYPNCIYPAIPIETHSWWDEDAAPSIHADSNRFTNDDAPRHLHLAACVPNARDDNSVLISQQTVPIVVRVMMFNNPSLINWVRWSWQSDHTVVTDTNLVCNTSVASHMYMAGRSECTWYVDLTIDPSKAREGIEELRMSPNINDHVGIGTRQFLTMNYQVPIQGKTGRFRSNNNTISRGWYTGLDYVNNAVNYLDMFDLPDFKEANKTRAVPLVKGVVPLTVEWREGNGTVKPIVWQDMNHHADPTFWKGKTTVGTTHSSGGKIVHVGSSQSGTESFNWDTRGLADGLHKLYFQNAESDATGVNAAATLFLFQVCNNGTASSCGGGTLPPGDTTAPTVSITAPASGATVSGTVTVSANASDNVGVTGVQFKLDGVNLGSEDIASPYSVSWNTTTIANGSHTLTATARDAAGNTMTSSAVAVTVDNVPSADTISPSAPAGFTAAAVSSSQINLSWNASTDNVGVTGYRVESCSGASCANFAEIAAPTATSYSNTGLTSNTSHTYRVRAADAAGNLSGYSATASATTQASAPSSTPVTLRFSPIADTMMKKAFPSSNYGSGSTMELDFESGSPTHKSIWKFTVSGVGGGTITSAKLRLYNVDSSDSGGSFYRVANNSWTESGLNWNNAPAADAMPVATLGAVTSGNWYEVDVKPIITGDGTVSIMAQNSSTNRAVYNSKEAASNKPELVITVGGATAAVSGQSATMRIARQMDIGATGNDVSSLQQFLASYDSVYPEGLVTGYFGRLTANAISLFQSLNGLPSVGRVGPLTLQKLNEFFTRGPVRSDDIPDPDAPGEDGEE